jgi:hypothetical protein
VPAGGHSRPESLKDLAVTALKTNRFIAEKLMQLLCASADRGTVPCGRGGGRGRTFLTNWPLGDLQQVEARSEGTHSVGCLSATAQPLGLRSTSAGRDRGLLVSVVMYQCLTTALIDVQWRQIFVRISANVNRIEWRHSLQ